MAILVNPQSELIREPRLLVPGQQPLGPVRVDWSHPLSIGLFDWSVRLTRFRGGGVEKQAATIVHQTTGLVHSLSGSSSGVIWTKGQPGGYSGLSLTFQASFATQNGCMIAESAESDNTGMFYVYGLSGTSLRLLTKNAPAGEYRTDFNYTLPSTWSVITIAFDLSVNPNYHKIFVNGTPIIDAAATTTVSAFAPATTAEFNLHFGHRGSYTLSTQSKFGDALLHMRMLRNDEIKTLHADFYQAFVPA